MYKTDKNIAITFKSWCDNISFTHYTREWYFENFGTSSQSNEQLFDYFEKHVLVKLDYEIKREK